jgi:hypothetical protein
MQQLSHIHFERLTEGDGVRYRDSPTAGLQRADTLPDPPEIDGQILLPLPSPRSESAHVRSYDGVNFFGGHSGILPAIVAFDIS